MIGNQQLELDIKYLYHQWSRLNYVTNGMDCMASLINPSTKCSLSITIITSFLSLCYQNIFGKIIESHDVRGYVDSDKYEGSALISLYFDFPIL